MQHADSIERSPSYANSNGIGQDPLESLENASPYGRTSTTPAPQSTSTARVRRRNRMITSCLECRRRKLKCDKSHPCAGCSKAARECVFLPPTLDSASQLKLTEIKEKMGSLEKVLEQDAKKGRQTNGRQRQGDHIKEEDGDTSPLPEDERDLEPTPLAVSDAVYDDDADDDFLDLGFQMGKLRLTDRVGGFFRPKMAEELSASLALNQPNGAYAAPSEREYTVNQAATHFVARPNTFLSPGPTYIAPTSSFFFSSSAHANSLIDFLPSQIVTDQLLAQYWESVHPIARAVHRSSFQRRYDLFWNDVSMGMEPANSLQAVVFAALFSGVVSMDEEAITRKFGVSKPSLVDNFQKGTETALSRANIIRTTKLETLQAFIMYMVSESCFGALQWPETCCDFEAVYILLDFYGLNSCS